MIIAPGFCEDKNRYQNLPKLASFGQAEEGQGEHCQEEEKETLIANEKNEQIGEGEKKDDGSNEQQKTENEELKAEGEQQSDEGKIKEEQKTENKEVKGEGGEQQDEGKNKEEEKTENEELKGGDQAEKPIDGIDETDNQDRSPPSEAKKTSLERNFSASPAVGDTVNDSLSSAHPNHFSSFPMD